MYFFKKDGKQHLDLTGNLILTHNDQLIKARQKSIAPVSAKHARFIEVAKLTFWGKLRAVWHTVRFVFGPSTALTEDVTDLQRPVRKN